MTAETVRERVRGTIPDTPSQMANQLSDCVTRLKALGLSTTVKTQRDLIPVLAADMAGEGGDPTTKTSDAEGQITSNNTTALTLSSDRYVGLEGGSKFDELHELIHICSAKGGASALHEWKLQMNEGAINTFAVLTATAHGVKVDDRYPEETTIVGSLLKLIKQYGDENEGYKKLYGMTFGGDQSELYRTQFFNLVGAAYVAIPKKGLADKDGKLGAPQAVRPDGKTPKSGTEKTWTGAQASDEFQSKVKNWTTKWLKERLPA